MLPIPMRCATSGRSHALRTVRFGRCLPFGDAAGGRGRSEARVPAGRRSADADQEPPAHRHRRRRRHRHRDRSSARPRRHQGDRPDRGGRHHVGSCSPTPRATSSASCTTRDRPGSDGSESPTSSNGAPSARNLLVTVFGDALLPHGVDTAVSVSSLATLLEPFGVSERLVRTSLTRLVNDGLLATRAVGRRSFYGVAPASTPLFRQADARIYGSRRRRLGPVVDDRGDRRHRGNLRPNGHVSANGLTWAGLGVVAPNVMASPVVTAEEAALVDRPGGWIPQRARQPFAGGRWREHDRRGGAGPSVCAARRGGGRATTRSSDAVR